MAKLPQVKSGYIPASITVVYAPKRKVNTQWDNSPSEDAFIVEREVYPGFALPAGDEKRLETARQWAQSHCSRYDIESRKQVNLGQPAEVSMPNHPQTLRVCGLEVRSEGGRAYKVVTNDNYYFDLREDVMLELMIECGIQKGGLLGGQFLWAVMGSQMRLVREGSILHKMMEEATQRGTMKKIGSQVQIGGVYRSKKGDTAIFLGHVMSAKAADQAPRKKMLWLGVPNYVTPEKIVKEFYDAKNFTIRRKPSEWLGEDFESPEYLYYLKMITSHSMVEQVGTVKLPKNHIKKAQELGVVAMQARMKHLAAHLKYSLKHATQYGLTAEKALAENKKSILDSLQYHYEQCHFYAVEGVLPVIDEYNVAAGAIV